jgi:hypothetical protein
MLASILRIYLSPNSREMKSSLLDTRIEPRREGGVDTLQSFLIKNIYYGLIIISIYHTLNLINFILKHVVADVQVVKITPLYRVAILIKCLFLYYTVLVLIIIKIVFALSSIKRTSSAAVLDFRFGYALCEL